MFVASAPAEPELDPGVMNLLNEASAPRAQAPAKPRRRATFSSVLGELLITVGVVVLMYVAWQMWIGDIIYGAENNAKGAALSEQWEKEAAELPALPELKDPADQYPMPELAHPADAEVFGNMIVPAWGADYKVPMAGGVTRPRTLDKGHVGLYPQSVMPGEIGNLTFAAHRTTWGAPFNKMAELRVGDAIVVEMPGGWYTYRFRNIEYVKPNEVAVLADVPQHPGIPANERYITLTSCAPKLSLAERIVGYGVFESYQPRQLGAPDSVKEGAR